MEYQFSTIIEPSSYQTEGLCDGIDLRMHNSTSYEDRGAIRAHQDWSKYVSPIKRYRGTLGPKYSFMTMTVPECIPERLEIISYANEFAFLHDDITDNVTTDLGEIENDKMMKAFQEGATNGSINHLDQTSSFDGKQIIQAQLLKEMMKIDRDCALVTMKAWAKFVEVGSSRKHETVFTRLDDYFPYRIMDVGEMFWYGVVTFGMGIKIPEDELPKCRELLRSAWIAVGLQNDLWSWPKEYEAAKKNGQSHVINALWVIMQEHDCTLETAQQTCRQLIKDHVGSYLEVVEKNRDNESLSVDLRKYIEAMKFSISGNVAWSLSCPRYNPGVSFNERQIAWMESGVPASLESSEHKHHVNGCGPAGPTQQNGSVWKDPSLAKCDVGSITQTLPYLCHKLIEAPFDYVDALPSKQIRSYYIDALNIWLEASTSSVNELKDVTKLLHNSSLLIDDFQDSSSLRRGKPAAHTIFGPPQTINSASYSILLAISRVMHSSNTKLSEAVVAQIMQMFVGQSYDLHWTKTLHVPTLLDYLQMIDSKTGTLFQLIADFLTNKANRNRQVSFRRLNTLLGRFFQIRDDLLNLTSADYTSQKGFCDDLDEGKYSLPIIHLLSSQYKGLEIQSILATRCQNGSLSHEQKRIVLDRLKEAGSLAYTTEILNRLHAELLSEVELLEKECSGRNDNLRTVLNALKY